MLPSRLRLTRGDFPKLYRRGQRRRSHSFVWWQLTVSATTPTRYGVVVSTRVARKATDRNLYKRRLWACLKALRAKLPALGYAIVVSAQPAIVGQSYARLYKELADFISSSQVLKSRPYARKIG